jgi:hypothetical protein
VPHQKVLFRLRRDDEGYPPADVEGVWAEETGDGGFIIDNIPFFTREATLGDVVEATRSGDELFYASTRERSGNSLLRVVFFDGHDPSALRSELAKLGCSTEQSHLQSLIAVNVPPAINIDEVRALLDDGSRNGFWDYEEPILRQ